MWQTVTLRARFRIFTYSYSPRRRFEPTHKEALPAGEAMRIRLKPTDTHLSPRHAATRAVRAGDRPSRPLRAPSTSPPVALLREKRGSQLQASSRRSVALRATDRFLFADDSSGYSLYVHGARSLTLRTRHPSPDHSLYPCPYTNHL